MCSKYIVFYEIYIFEPVLDTVYHVNFVHIK